MLLKTRGTRVSSKLKCVFTPGICDAFAWNEPLVCLSVLVSDNFAKSGTTNTPPLKKKRDAKEITKKWIHLFSGSALDRRFSAASQHRLTQHLRLSVCLCAGYWTNENVCVFQRVCVCLCFESSGKAGRVVNPRGWLSRKASHIYSWLNPVLTYSTDVRCWDEEQQ